MSEARRGTLPLSYLAVLLGRAVLEAVESADGGSRMPTGDAKALFELCLVGPVTAGCFARLLGVNQSAVTVLADRLEAEGLLERRRDSSDRRRVWLHTTPKALQRLEELAPGFATQANRVFESLTPGAGVALTALLEDIVLPWLEDQVPAGDPAQR